LFVWEVLSVHSVPRKRDAAFGALRRIRALTPDSMSRVPRKQLEESVALAGSYAELRLRALATGVDRFRRAPALSSVIRGAVPGARRALKTLPQMGEGGAHRMLLFAANRPVLPVDMKVRRVAERLGYGTEPRPPSPTARLIRTALAAEMDGDPETCRRTFLYFSHHAAATCTEADPRCSICPLLRSCPFGQRKIARRPN
jgi:endonuclease-3